MQQVNEEPVNDVSDKEITDDDIVYCPRHTQHAMWICCTRPWGTSWWCAECDKEYERNHKGDLVIKPEIRIRRTGG